MMLGELLIAEGALDAEGLQEALDWQVLYGGRLGTNLLELGLVDEAVLARALGKQQGCEVAFGELQIAPELVGLVPGHVADRQEIIPWKMERRRLKVICAVPDVAVFDGLAYKLGRPCTPVVAPEFRIIQLLRRDFGAKRQMRALDFGVIPEEQLAERRRKRKRVAEGAGAEAAPELIDESAFNDIYNQVLAGRDAKVSAEGRVRAQQAPARAPSQRSPPSPGSSEPVPPRTSSQLPQPLARVRVPSNPALAKVAPRPPGAGSPPPVAVADWPLPDPASPSPAAPHATASRPPAAAARSSRAQPNPPAVAAPRSAHAPVREDAPLVDWGAPHAPAAPRAPADSQATSSSAAHSAWNAGSPAQPPASPSAHPASAPFSAPSPQAPPFSRAALAHSAPAHSAPAQANPLAAVATTRAPAPGASASGAPPGGLVAEAAHATAVAAPEQPGDAELLEELEELDESALEPLEEEPRADRPGDTAVDLQPVQFAPFELAHPAPETEADVEPEAEAESESEAEAPLARVAGKEPPAIPAWDMEPPHQAPVDVSPLAFKDALAQLNGVTDRDAIAHIVLRCARGTAARALLMTVQGGVALGWDGLGEGLENGAARAVAVPLSGESVFQFVVQMRSHYMGSLRKTPANVRFLAQCGKKVPLSALVLPILFRGRVSHLLYLDNGHKQQAPTEVGEMLILAQKVTQTVDALVAKKQRSPA